MTAADRPAAPELSPAEAKRLDQPEAAEGLRIRTVAAMRATRECQAGMAFGVPPDAREMFLGALADAAIAAITQPVEGAPAVPDPAAAVARVEALAENAEERGEGICRTCLAPIWNEGGTISGVKRAEGWSDRIERGGDSLICFKARGYRHVPLAGREAAIYDRAHARGAGDPS